MTDNVLQGGSHRKVLLLQAELLPLKELQTQDSSCTNTAKGATTGPQDSPIPPPPRPRTRHWAWEGGSCPRDCRDVCVWMKEGTPLSATILGAQMSGDLRFKGTDGRSQAA